MSTLQVPQAPVIQAYVAPAWSTPQILKTGMAAIWVASLLLMLATISGARSHRHAIQVVGKDSAPSIIAAEHIRAALADMDAQTANELFGGRGAADAVRSFEARRSEAVIDVVKAAENITYGDSERAPIQTLALGIGAYQAYIQTARDKNSVPAWRQGAQFMDKTLLPAAEDLDHANRKALDDAYSGQRAASVRASVFLILTVLVVGGVLITTQIFLAGRMRRVLNPGLFLASLAAFIFAVYTGQRFAASDQDLKMAKEDAFESIHWLWQARAVAYSANGDESRFLVDPEHAADYERDFLVKATRISGEFLPNEVKNVTFEGEAEAANKTVAAFEDYLRIDKQIRALEKSGHHAEAVALCTGNGTGQSNWAFGKFDEALGKTLDVNQQAFDLAVARGFQDVAGFEVSAPVMAFLISVLGWLGLRGRIREYSA